MDAFFEDDYEHLPGDYLISNGNLKKFYNKESFVYCDSDGKDIIVEYNQEMLNHFLFYYNVWENFHYFGLPHGKGWLDENEWTLDFLKNFQRIYNEIELYRFEKNKK